MRRAGATRGEAGFSLVELLAVIAILGVISFALTESLIVGFKTTDGTTREIAHAVNVQAMKSYFTGDAQSAKLVSSKDPAPTPACTSSTEVFLHLSWTDQDNRARKVSYSFEPETAEVPGERELVRWSCANGVLDSKRPLGHCSVDPIAPLPVQARCDTAACPTPPDPPGRPVTVTMNIASQEPPTSIELKVRRRSA